MDLAWRLLKQGLELQPPMTQGVEEEMPPVQENIPTVDVDTMGGGDGDCCEAVREWLLRPLKPESEGYNRIMNASCEEIKSGQVGSTKFLYDKVAEVMGCSEGFSSEFQDIHTGEPMDLAWRLLKAPLDFESVRDVGVVEEGGFPYRRFEADFIDPETQERLPAFARLSDDGVGVGRIQDPDPESLLRNRAFHMIHPYGDKGIYPYSIGTDKNFRGRGYQEALLNLIMRLAEAEGKTFYEPPQSSKTGDGNMFAQRMREKYGDKDVEVITGEPMDLSMRLLKGKFDLIPMEAANELLMFHDAPTIIRWHNDKYGLGLSEEGLSQDETDELHSHIMDSDTAFEPSVPGGISHAENVEQYEKETGKPARPMGLNMQLGDVPVIDPTKPETWKDGPGTTWAEGKPTVSPQITQQPFPYDFDYIHQGEPMDLAWRLLK